MFLPAQIGWKLNIIIDERSHLSAKQGKPMISECLVTKQLQDKERVQAAFENPELLEAAFGLVLWRPELGHEMKNMEFIKH